MMCSNLIKNCIEKNKKGFFMDYNNKNINNIKVFIKLNIIKFIKIKNNKIIVFVNYKNNKPIFKNIINMYRKSNKKTIKINYLKNICLKKNYFFIMSTNKGILNSYEALKLSSGGVILSQIWN